MWQKNIENGEFLKAERLQDGYVFATEEEIKAFQVKEMLEGMGYEVETTTESSTGKTLSSSGGNEITLEYALILNQQVGMIEKTEAIREELLAEGKVNITFPNGNSWLVKINESTRNELLQMLEIVRGTNQKGFFRNWVGEFTQIEIGEEELSLYKQTATTTIQNIHSIFRDIGTKIEALKTQEDIDNFPLQEELARLTSLREGLGVGVKRTVPNYEVTNEREMKLS